MSPNRILATAFLFASAFASADVHIDESIPYRDKEEIDTRIVSECLEVGSIMSKSLQETAAKSDVTVVRDGKKQGTYAEYRHYFRHERRQCLYRSRQRYGGFSRFVC